MVLLSEIRKKLKVKTNKEALDIIEKVTWKKYSEKTSRISDKVWEEVESKYLSKWDKKEIVKENEIVDEEESFLQSFGIVVEKKEVEDEIEEDIKKERKVYKMKKKEIKEKKFKKDYITRSKFKKYSPEDFKREKFKVEKKKKFTKEEYKKPEKFEEKVVKSAKQQSKPVKKEETPKVSDTLVKKDEILIPSTITVKEFSEKLWIPLQEVMKKLLMNKIIVSANSNIDFETAMLIADEFGVKVKKEDEWLNIEDLIEGNIEKILKEDLELAPEDLVERPPIVTIMWHVDHWKTKLLDYIRQTNITEKEAWGITQSIWASQIQYEGKKITFIDTPWHELFTELRARWAKVTDIVIIAIAADEGVKQQTIEAINHAKEANVPIIVAATKIDKPNANIDFVKSQISEHWLIPEDRWGDVPVIWVSAISWEGVDELLEMILLQAEMLELKYNPKRPWIGVILEAHKDIKKGVLASVILMTWTMKKWDPLLVFDTYGKVRRLIDWKWNDLQQIQWWDPALILWIQDLPQPWRLVEVVWSEKEARDKSELVKEKVQNMNKQSALSAILDKIQKWDKVQLKLILKADSFGSLEALKYAVSKISVPENVEIKVIHSDIWPVSDSDVVLADASNAVIIWFNIPFSSSIKKKADNLKVDIKNFHIIYELIDYIEKLVQWLVEPEEREEYIGKLEVLGVFFKRWNDMIVWWKVIDWKVINWAIFKLFRKNKQTGELEEIGWWKVTSLKRETENVDEVKQGYECWLRVKTSKKIQIWDIMEFYEIVKW